jgi:signal transduction histidine kinase
MDRRQFIATGVGTAAAMSSGGVAAQPRLDVPTPEATARLQETHVALQSQVERLQAELAEANERLRRSRSLAALGEMAAGIAHEIRNPLGAIALNAELLTEDVADRPEAAASVPPASTTASASSVKPTARSQVAARK